MGNLLGEKSVSEITNESLVSMMVGRKLDEQFPHVEVQRGKKF